MASGSDSGTVGNDANSESSPSLDNWPLWQYVIKEGKLSEGRGNTSFKCNFRNVTYKGSYSRVKSHLLKIVGGRIKGCPKITVGVLNKLSKLEDEAISRRESSCSKVIYSPRPVSSSSHSSSHSVSVDALNQFSYVPKKRKIGGDSALVKAFNLQVMEQLDIEIARMFYSPGLPFNLARNPHFIQAFSFAANSGIAGYVPPGYNALRTKLLQKERINIENLLESTKSTWRNKGVSLVCDVWTYPQRRPLIKAINESGPVFICAINCEGEYKDKNFISGLIKNMIAQIGPANVVQVITDNAPVCRAAGLLVKQTYSHIFWTPCVMHTLNLALKNICAAKNTDANGLTYSECHWITNVASSAIMIWKFIINHSMRLSIFNEFCKVKLLAVAETRFDSTIVMLKRFKLIKQQLQSMVISEKWSCYREDDVEKARFVKEKL